MSAPRRRPPGTRRIDVAVVELDLGAHRLQALEVLVDRARRRSRSRRAATRARGRSARRAVRARARDARICCTSSYGASVVCSRAPCTVTSGGAHLDREAHVPEQLGRGLDVAQVGHVAERARAVREQRRAEQRQRRVLRAADRNRAREPATADDVNAVHGRVVAQPLPGSKFKLATARARTGRSRPRSTPRSAALRAARIGPRRRSRAS